MLRVEVWRFLAVRTPLVRVRALPRVARKSR